MYRFILLSIISGSPQYSTDRKVVYLTPPLINPSLLRNFESYNNRNLHSITNEYESHKYYSNIKQYSQIPGVTKNEKIDSQYLKEPSQLHSIQNRIDSDIQPTKTSKIQANKFSQSGYYSNFGGFSTSKSENLPLPTPEMIFNQYSQTDNNIALTTSDTLTFLGLISAPTETEIFEATATPTVARSLEDTLSNSLPTPTTVSSIFTTQIKSTANTQIPIIFAPNITIVIIEEDKDKNRTTLPTTETKKQYQSVPTVASNWKLPWKTYF